MESLPDSGIPGGIGDAELAKHYLTHTLQTFAEGGMNEDQSNMWRILIPAMALTCPVIRHGMLTLGAICLHYDSSPDHSDEHCLRHLEAAEAHGKIFVKGSRQKIQDFQAGLNMQDQDSVLTCSRLMCLLAFAFFRTHRRNGTTLGDPAAWTWLHLLRGVKTSYVAAVESGGPIDKLFVKDMTPPLPYRQPSPLAYQSPCFCYVQQSQRVSFDALRSTLYRNWSFLGDQKTEDLGAAIDLLSQVSAKVCSQQLETLFRTICTWPGAIPRGFVDMLMEGSPPALVVYAHWLVLMVLVEDLWWVDDMGRAGIREIIAKCSDADCGTRSLLFWPQQVLDVRDKSVNILQ